MAKMNKWKLEQSDLVRRRMGKTGEELSELGAVVSRIQIQGLDAIDPGTGKSNRLRLLEETADVMAQCYCNIEALELSGRTIDARCADKVKKMMEWEELYGLPAVDTTSNDQRMP